MDAVILYYTSNKIPDFFATNVRLELLKVTDLPIISISQKPMGFGYENICVGEIGASTYNVYKQILAGAYKVGAKYVFCCEDDTLYTPEHFTITPPDDTFYYNRNRWIMEGWGAFRYRNRTTMCGCIAATELMIKTLEARFKKYPEDPKNGIPWGEPGRVEHHYGLPKPPLFYFKTKIPIVTFNHNYGLCRRRRSPEDIIQSDLEPWGNAVELWRRIHG